MATTTRLIPSSRSLANLQMPSSRNTHQPSSYTLIGPSISPPYFCQHGNCCPYYSTMALSPKEHPLRCYWWIPYALVPTKKEPVSAERTNTDKYSTCNTAHVRRTPLPKPDVTRSHYYPQDPCNHGDTEINGLAVHCRCQQAIKHIKSVHFQSSKSRNQSVHKIPTTTPHQASWKTPVKYVSASWTIHNTNTQD